MSRRKSPSSSRRRRVFIFQTLEDRRVLATTTPDVVELTNVLGTNIYSGGFEQRSTVAPQYATDAQGNRAIDLRVDLTGDQTVAFPSIGINDDGPYANEQASRIVRILVDPNEKYLITSSGSNRAETRSIPISAFNDAGELLERLVLPLEYDPALNFAGLSRGYIGDVNWFSSPALKLPPQTTSIVAAHGAIYSIGFASDEFEGASQAVRWSDEPLLVSSKPVDFIEADSPVAVDSSKVYTLDVSLSTTSTDGSKHSVGYTAYDRDGLLIEPQHVARYLNAADTTLARELRTGDTFIDLVDATGWSNLSSDPATRTLAWYGYQDYANYSYTRNVATAPGLGLWAAGAVVGNRITLLKPWAGPTLPSGLAVRNAVAGSPLFAVLADDQPAPLKQARDITGNWRSGTQNPAAFPPGAAAIRPAVELNQVLTITGKTSLTYRVATNKSPSLPGSSTRIVTIDVLANDSGVGANATITQVTAPKFGSAEIVSGAAGRPVIKYSAISYFVGVDRFSYTVTNNSGNTFTEEVSVTSLGSNLESDPVLSQRIANYPGTNNSDIITQFSLYGTSYEVLQGSELVISNSLGPRIAEDLGEGSMPIFVSLVTAPTHGGIQLEPNGAFRYFAEPDYAGDVGFIVNVSNGTKSLDVRIGISVRGTAAEVDQSKLGKIGLAEELFYSAQQQYFYPMVPGQPRLSWRVHVLPYLGYSKLHGQFRFDEPWDSPNNLPLAAQMPDIFRSAGDTAGNLTRFQTIVGSQSSPTKHWLTENATPRARRGIATHGEGNSILVLQTAPQHAVIWTKPDDLIFNDAQSTLAKLTAPLFPAYFWFNSTGTPGAAVLVPQDVSLGQFQSIATIAESPGVVGVDVARLARGWAERPDTPATIEQFGVPKATFNVRAISIALSNYESSFKLFPQAAKGTNATELTPVSWRVQILPLIGQSTLYSRYKFNEPWDSPSNLALLNEMPDVFRSANDLATSTTTRIRFLDGTDTAHDRARTRLRIVDFRDGMSNTILFVEAGVDKAVPWTQPEALPVDMANIWASLGSFPGGFMRIGMADRSHGMLGTGAPNADASALLTIGLATTTTRPREELYDGQTLIRRSGMTVPADTVATLKMLGLAAQNFESGLRRFPSNVSTTTAPIAPLLSWRVAILPYMEAGRLYQEFRLNEPWDSPHNLSLMEYMPYWLRSVGDPSDSTNTRFQSFVGSSSFVNSTGKQVRINDLLKGTSNTLAYVQAGRDKAVPWTKPSDVNGDAVDIWKELGQVGRTAPFTMADTAVKVLTRAGTEIDNLNNAANIAHELTRTIIQANTLVIREGDFARVDLINQAFDEVLEMDSQSFLTMTRSMTFAAAENNTLDGTRKVQLRWGKRSNPADPTSPLIVSQTLDVYVIDNESLLLTASPSRVTENGSQINFVVTRGTVDTSTPLTVTISSNASDRIQLPTSVVIPAGQMQVAFAGVTINNSRIEGPVSIQVAASTARHLDSIAAITIVDDDTLRITINPSTIKESGGSATGTVTRLFGSFAEPLTVSLSTSDLNTAQVDSQVTIPAGRNSASFLVTAVSDATYDGVQSVSIIADANTYGRAEGRLTVNDFEPLLVRVQGPSISERGGSTLVTVIRGAVGLDRPLVVQLQSSDTSELTVPATLTIPAGERDATFTATAVDDRLLDGTQTVTISASSEMVDSGSAAVRVFDYEELSLTFAESSISENGGANRGRVTRSNIDIDQPLVVSLRSIPNDQSLQFAPTVTIPAGATFVDFEVRAVDDSLLNRTRPFTFYAENSDYAEATSTFVVTDEEHLQLTVNRSTLSERSDLTTARVTRLNTDTDQEQVVLLTSLAALTALDFPTSVTIPGGSAYVDFEIKTLDNHRLSGTQQITISAESPLYFSSTVQIEVTDYEELTLQFDQLSVAENGIALAYLARGDWDDVSQPLTVQLRADIAGLLDLPATVTIPTGVLGVYFNISAIDNDVLSASKNVVVEALHSAYVTLGDSIAIDDYETLSLQFDLAGVSEAGQTLGRVIRSNSNIEQAITVDLIAATPGIVRLPASVTIPAGSAFATFTIEGIDNNTVEATRTVEIKASHPAYNSVENSIQVTDYEPLELTLSTTQQWEGSSITATVTRNVVDLSQETVVNIAISDRSQATSPDFVIIPANERFTTFTIELPRDRIRDGNKTVVLDVHSDSFVSARTQIDTMDLESLWHNPRSSLDVNDDGVVSPLDALLVINFLNTARGPVSQLVRPGLAPLFLDTSNDGNLSPLDALLVINHLNQRANGEGESTAPKAGDTAVDQALWQMEEELRGKRNARIARQK